MDFFIIFLLFIFTIGVCMKKTFKLMIGKLV